jgi:hypothetical protein
MRNFLFVFCAALLTTACGGRELVDVDAGSSPPDSGDETPDGGCRTNADCASQPDTTCAGPYGTGGCVCQDAPTCTDDTQCTVGTVCSHLLAGVCQGYETLHCVPPCRHDSDCTPTDACSSDGHCEPRTCANCPSFFTCSNDVCIQPTCTTDAECPGGFCVDGSCAVSLGMCTEECV